MNINVKRAEQGIALIIVLISILVLAVLAGGFAYSMKVETTLARNANSETELEWIGRSGVEYCRWILAQPSGCPGLQYDGLDQVWAGGSGGACSTNSALSDVQREIHLGHGSFTWKMTDMERKYNINMANEAVLQQAFLVMGVDAGDMGPIIGSILNWTASGNNTKHMQGVEPEFYQSADPPYVAKDGPIDDITEVLLIAGVTPEMFWGNSSTNHPQGAFQLKTRGGVPVAPPAYTAGLAELFTPMSSGRININTASAEVIQLIPGIDANMAQAIVAGRQGEDDGSGLLGPYRTVQDLQRVPDLPPALRQQIMSSQMIGTQSTVFEVQIDAVVAGYKRQFSAVLGRNPRNPRDVQILTFYWK
jgi:general secretion pathway protein K